MIFLFVFVCISTVSRDIRINFLDTGGFVIEIIRGHPKTKKANPCSDLGNVPDPAAKHSKWSRYSAIWFSEISQLSQCYQHKGWTPSSNEVIEHTGEHDDCSQSVLPNRQFD